MMENVVALLIFATAKWRNRIVLSIGDGDLITVQKLGTSITIRHTEWLSILDQCKSRFRLTIARGQALL